MGSFSGFHTEQMSGIASYFEHPLDVTTSQNFAEIPSHASYITSGMSLDEHKPNDDATDTSSILYNEVAKESRRRDFQQLKDPKI